MKKQMIRIILTLLVTLAIIFNCTGIANAASSIMIYLNAPKVEYIRGEEVEVTVSLKDINVGDGINTLKGTVEWDNNIFDIVGSIEALNGWAATWNEETNSFVMIHMSGLVKEDSEVAKIKFKVKDDAEIKETAINMNDIEAANTQEKVTCPGLSLALKIVDNQQNDGNNDQENNDEENNDQGSNDEENNDQGNNDEENNDQGNDNEENNDEGSNDEENNDQGSNDEENNDQGNDDEENNDEGNQIIGGTEQEDNDKEPSTPKKDDETQIEKIPYAGIKDTVIIISIIVITFGTIAFIKYKKYKGI